MRISPGHGWDSINSRSTSINKYQRLAFGSGHRTFWALLKKGMAYSLSLFLGQKWTRRVLSEYNEPKKFIPTKC